LPNNLLIIHCILNPSKSSLLIVDFSILLSRIQSFDIFFNSVPIPRSSSIKILGVHVDSSWTSIRITCARQVSDCLRPSMSSLSFRHILFCFQKFFSSQLLVIFLIIRYFMITLMLSTFRLLINNQGWVS